MKNLMFILFIAIASCTGSGNRNKEDKDKIYTEKDKVNKPFDRTQDTLININKEKKVHSDDKLLPKENKKDLKRYSPVQQARGGRKGKPVKYPPPPPPPIDTTDTDPPTFPPTDVPQALAYLDFDGEQVPINSGWVGNQSWTSKPSNLTLDEQNQVLYKVQTIYAKYNYFITRNRAEYDAWTGPKQMVLIHPETPAGYQGSSGVSYVGSTFNGASKYTLVFEDRVFTNWSYVADVTIHELGHSIALYHQSVCQGGTVTVQYRDECWMGYCFNISYWVIGLNSWCAEQNDDLILTTNLGLKN